MLSYDIIIVVPLSWKRRLQRGYNQSQLIAEIISSILQIKIESRILYKTKNIVPQSTLNKKERKEKQKSEKEKTKNNYYNCINCDCNYDKFVSNIFSNSRSP